ncbi:MAG: hypothetical protein M1377_04035 [Deltaproteobacteria bacterium]|nr:hypothetical protein [Deltaproteobacteria bacterium]
MWLDDLRRFLAAKVAPPAREAAAKIEGEAIARAPGAPRWLVRCLLILAALGICAGLYYAKWRLWPAKPNPVQTPVATQGGGNVYQGNQVPAMAKAAKVGHPKPRISTRPVATIPAAELPPEEQAKVPAVAPAAGPDNVIRGMERLDSAVVPPSRGETYVRTDLLPSGAVQTTLDPQKEPFFGLPWRDGNWKRVEIEGGYGVGGRQIDVQASWWPVRIGNVHLGARAETWAEPGGGMKGAASIRFRWEPFR